MNRKVVKIAQRIPMFSPISLPYYFRQNFERKKEKGFERSNSYILKKKGNTLIWKIKISRTI